jgi:UDP-2,3-diacylglucosamine hydrolase
MANAELRCLFLSDVHLPPGGGEKTERFLKFLRGAVRRFDRLYILGDLLDFWIGPGHLELPDFQHVFKVFRALRAAGLRAAFVPGNRDYQVGPEFERASGIEILPPQIEIALGGRRVYLSHGDFFYNRNPRYTAYRRIAGARGARYLIAGLPSRLALRLAAAFREVSRRDTPAPPFRTDADLLKPVRPLFARGIDVVLCGHLHRSAHLQAKAGGRPCELFLLGEWGERCPHVRYEGGRFEERDGL